MNDKEPPNGGGKYNVYDLDITEIDEASRTDFAKVPELETRRDGWKAYRDMMLEMRSDLEAELPNLEENFDSEAGKVFAKALKQMVASTGQQHDAAENNRITTDLIITEVKRVRPLIEEVMEDRRLANENRNSLQAMPQDGSNAYDHALEDTLNEARRTFSESDSVYGKENTNLVPPPKYTGPVYSGPGPKTPLDDNYQHAYYPDDTPYRGGNTGAGGGAPGSGGSSGSGSDSPPVSSRPGDSDGPELQNPGSPPPTSTNPPPVTNAPGPNPGQGTVPPPYVPGGGQPTGPVGSKPVSPLGTRPNTGPLNGAKPTPGMTRPMTSGSGTGPRSTAPMSGRTATGGAPKNSMLPNQRQVAAGKTPVTGSGRVPSGTTSRAGSARGVTSAGSARPGSVPSGAGRGGLVRKPNAGFEESLYRNTRAGRTVPGVIGGRGADGKASNGSGRAAGAQGSRVASAGKVIGGRANKGQRGGGKPKLQSGSLTNTTAKSKKDTRHTWQRTPVEQSTQPPSGAVAISRNAPKRPQTPDEIAEAKLQARKKWRRKFYASKQEPKLEPASELFGGTEGKVTRGVIRGAGASEPVDRRDAGTRFSTYGWENDA